MALQIKPMIARSTVLPPLSEFSHPAEHAADIQTGLEPNGHHRPLRNISETERTIIGHLKKKLSRRVERRMSREYESDELQVAKLEEQQRATSERRRKAREERRLESKEPENAIFTRYNDFGEKMVKAIGYKRANAAVVALHGRPPKARLAPLTRLTGGTNTTIVETVEMMSALASPALMSPEVLLSGSVPNKERAVNGSAVRRRALTFSDDINMATDLEPELVALGPDTMPSLEETMAMGIMSPVPTPHIALRPITREQTRLNAQDRVKRLLRGSVSIKCPEDMRTARVYISTSGHDTKDEQNYFVEHLYPELKEHSAAYDCELQLVDMHWAMTDTCVDSHAYEDSCLRALELCQTGRGLSYILLTSGKYGRRILPAEVPQDEFKVIHASLEGDYLKLVDEISIIKAKQKAEEEAEKAASQKAAAAAAAAAISIAQGDEDEEVQDRQRPKKKSQKDRQANLAILQLISSKERDAEIINPKFLTSWYKLDENCLPPVYRLQRVSTQYPDITKSDAGRRKFAFMSWLETASRLRGLLHKHASGGASSDKFAMSLLDMEVRAGLASGGTAAWFSKKFDSIQESDPQSSTFVEHRDDMKLKMHELERTIKSHNLPDSLASSMLLEWTKDGFVPNQLRAHQLYIEKVSSRLGELIKGSLASQFQDEAAAMPAEPLLKALYIEVSQHVTFCQERARHFHGRKELLTTAKKFVCSTSPSAPFVILGKSGNGRKSLVCRAARDSQKWSNNCAAIVFRSVGLTGESANVRTLMFSLCTQLSIIFDLNLYSVPTDYKGLVNDLSEKLHLASSDQPLIVVIDSLDQLTDEYDARKLNWLPKELPDHLHLILSTLPDEKFGTLDSLKKVWGDRKSNFLEVGEMPIIDALVILDHWLYKANRTLTQSQQTTLIEAFKQCANPLYLQVVFQESVTWPSYATPEQYKLVIGVRRVATVMFGRLEREHGEILVRRALGYLTAARRGLTQNELEDLLSLDEPVMDELTAQLDLPLRRCPTFVVVRLLQDLLGSYIIERAADARRTLQWSHSQFREAATERYLLQRDKAPSYHKAMAEYFSGRWSRGEEKPCGTTEQVANRFVASQGLATTVHTEDGGVRTVYNLRALNELPYHFMNSQQFDALKTNCLCNYEWLLAKLCGCSFRALFDDYQLALAIEPRDKDLNLLLETMNLSRAVLENDPRQLGSQLAGRIQNIIRRDVPVAPQDPRVYPACHPLISQISKSSIPTFVPSGSCLTVPGGALADVLMGHQGEITSLGMASDGMTLISTSKDNTMKMWDLRSGKVVSSLSNVGCDVLEVLFACGDALTVTSEQRCIRVWDMAKNICVHTVSDFDDYATLSVTSDGKILAAYFVGHNTMRSWMLEGSFKKIQDCQLEASNVNDREKSLMVSKRSCGDLVLVAFQDASQATTHNVKTGEYVHTLVCSEPSARILALAISNDYFIVANRFKFFKKEEPFALDLFSCQGGALVRSVRGCCEDNITSLQVNSVGSHALCLSTSRQTWCADLAVWNLETEEHKHLAMHAGLGTQFATGDLRYAASACQGECGVRVWNISASVTKPGSKAKQSVGVAALVPMRDNPRYVVAASTDNGPLSVWNAAKGKTSGSAVRIEHGLMDPHDVVVVRNTKAVILGDRGLSPVSGEAIFQTIYVYDLRTKRYERKVPGVYIIPSQPHEFALLSDDYLLGLSENRTHFIVWNLMTGVLAYRIKPNFANKSETTVQISSEAATLSKRRNATAKMTPWDRRAETESARQRRREQQMEEEMRVINERHKEKENGIEQFVMSGDEKIIVASFFAHHFCVFDVEKREHIKTLENVSCLMHLYVARLTYDGHYLVHTNYDEECKASYITLWDCYSGEVKKRLKNENDVRALGISDDGQRVVVGKGQSDLRVWDPMQHGSLRKLKSYSGLRFLPAGNKIFMLKSGKMAVVFSGDISVWDLDSGANLAVFTPDTRIGSIAPALDGRVLCFGLRDSPSVIILRLMSGQNADEKDAGSNIFGEVRENSDSDDEGAM